MTYRDFVLLGSSVAVIIIALWPAPADRQWLEVKTAHGQRQRYSVAVDDPSLESINLRLKKWETPASSRALRTARWHQALADFYGQHPCFDNQNAGKSGAPVGDPDHSVAQVSFVNSKIHDIAIDYKSFWTNLSKASANRIRQEEQRIQTAQAQATPPVVLGPVVRAARPAVAYPFALFAALTTVLLCARRQRARPPIELACQVDRPVDFAESQVICLRIPSNWVRIRQPVEVVVWRMVYATAVATAVICLVLFS